MTTPQEREISIGNRIGTEKFVIGANALKGTDGTRLDGLDGWA
jgi:hypothetical protein